MKFPSFCRTVGAVSTIALFSILAAPAGAQSQPNGLPNDGSTPQEKAETAQLNNDISAGNAMADQKANAENEQYQDEQQQYQQQQQQYQNQKQIYENQQAGYQDRRAAYEALRARYARERAAYHRALWPDRYAYWLEPAPDSTVIGERVELLSGSNVGTVVDVAYTPGGRIEALLVRLDNDKLVWLDSTDVRYNRDDRVIMTDLDSRDLHQMADERF